MVIVPWFPWLPKYGSWLGAYLWYPGLVPAYLGWYFGSVPGLGSLVRVVGVIRVIRVAEVVGVVSVVEVIRAVRLVGMVEVIWVVG